MQMKLICIINRKWSSITASKADKDNFHIELKLLVSIQYIFKLNNIFGLYHSNY